MPPVDLSHVTEQRRSTVIQTKPSPPQVSLFFPLTPLITLHKSQLQPLTILSTVPWIPPFFVIILFKMRSPNMNTASEVQSH